MAFNNLKKIRFFFLPWFYRNETNNELIDAYVSELGTVNDKDAELDALKKQVIYSAEKILLEAFCNDNYDNDLRRIFIGQSFSPNDLFLGSDAEEPTGVVFLGSDAEEPDGVEFIGADNESGSQGKVVVNIPNVLSSLNDIIKQGVENYVRIPFIVEIVNF